MRVPLLERGSGLGCSRLSPGGALNSEGLLVGAGAGSAECCSVPLGGLRWPGELWPLGLNGLASCLPARHACYDSSRNRMNLCPVSNSALPGVLL